VKNKISIIIEARSTSKRLPKKILLKVKKKTLLEHLINRLKKVKKINNIIIATTTNYQDDKIVALAKKNKVNYYRGSELNVLDRVIKAAKKFNTNIIVRVTSDCPIIDIHLVDQCLEIFLNNSIDIVSNAFLRSYPDGMDVEILKLSTLQKSYKYAHNPFLREHITLAIKNNPRIFKHLNVIAPSNLFYPHIGLTLDEYPDYILIKKIITYFFKKKKFLFTCHDILDLLKKKKNYLSINKSIKRSTYDFKKKN
jgi:spore coat polysaccharide biosynthesis protein SpsF